MCAAVNEWVTCIYIRSYQTGTMNLSWIAIAVYLMLAMIFSSSSSFSFFVDYFFMHTTFILKLAYWIIMSQLKSNAWELLNYSRRWKFLSLSSYRIYILWCSATNRCFSLPLLHTIMDMMSSERAWRNQCYVMCSIKSTMQFCWVGLSLLQKCFHPKKWNLREEKIRFIRLNQYFARVVINLEQFG